MSKEKKDRRLAILNAAINLLAEKGFAGVTHRAADIAAGLPQGSTTYYYSKKLDLLRAAADHLADELEKGCEAIQIAFAEIVAREGLDVAVARVATELICSADLDRHLTLARIEMTLAAARDPEFADVGARLAKAAQRPIEFFVSLVADEKSNFPMETAVGLIDGIAILYATGQAPQPTADQLSAVLGALARGEN